MRKKIEVTWNDYGIYIRDLIMQIEREGKVYNAVYGIPRGGLPIAVAISNYFSIPIVQNVKDTDLIVDDISDSGTTLLNILYSNFGNKRENHPDVATMFLGTESGYQPLYWCKKINKLHWIDFPYEYPDRPDTISEVINS